MASITIKNTDRLLKKLNHIANVDTIEAMRNATMLVHGQAKELASASKYGNGDLAGSIHMQIKKNKDSVMGRVYTNKNYAPYVEFGTGSVGNGTYKYKIKDLALTYADYGWVYYNEDLQQFVYTKGMKARPYMYPSLHRNKKYIKNLFKTDVKSKIDSICKGG